MSTARIASAIRDSVAAKTGLRIAGRGTWLDAGELDQLLHPERKDLFHRVMSVFR